MNLYDLIKNGQTFGGNVSPPISTPVDEPNNGPAPVPVTTPVPEVAPPRRGEVQTIFFYESRDWENMAKLRAIFNELGQAIRDYPYALYKVNIDVSGYTPPGHESE